MSDGEPPRKRKTRRAPRRGKSHSNWKRFGEMSAEERRKLEERDMHKRKTKDEQIGLTGGTCDRSGRLIAPVAPPITDEANNREREERSAQDARVAQEERDWDLAGLAQTADDRQQVLHTPVSLADQAERLATRHEEVDEWFRGLESENHVAIKTPVVSEAPATPVAATGLPAAADAPWSAQQQHQQHQQHQQASGSSVGVEDGMQGGGLRLILPWTGSRQPIDLSHMTREELVANIYAAVGYVTLLKSQAAGNS